MPRPEMYESGLRRATGLLKRTAEQLQRANPADPLASHLLECVAEYKGILGDPADWNAVNIERIAA